MSRMSMIIMAMLVVRMIVFRCRWLSHHLIDLGAVNAAMSGSGASVFALFDKKETRQAAIKALDNESTWRKFAVATISRTEYREALRC